MSNPCPICGKHRVRYCQRCKKAVCERYQYRGVKYCEVCFKVVSTGVI